MSLKRRSSTFTWRHEAVRLAALMAVSDNQRASRPLTTRLRPGVYQVALNGDLDATNTRSLTLSAQAFLHSDHASADVDLRSVTFIGSTGLLLLVRLHRTAALRGGTVTLLEPSTPCMRQLERLGFDKIFTVRRGTSPSQTLR